MQRRDANCRNGLVAVPRSPLLFHCSSLFSVQASRCPCSLIPPCLDHSRNMSRCSDRPLRMWQRMKQEGCSQPRQSDRTGQGGIGPRGKHPCILHAYSMCRSFAPHVEGEGSIYLGNGEKGLSSVAVGETAGIFSDVVLAAKDCGTVRRPTTRRPRLQAIAAWDFVSAFRRRPG